VLALCWLGPACATEIHLEKLYFGLETYYYPEDGAPHQDHGSTAVITQAEFQAALSSHWSARITPFARLDGHDSNRTRFDLREAEVDYAQDRWRLAVGARRLSWSVTESVNIVPYQVVDIINQRDLAGDPAGQEKLGAVMAVASYQADNTLVQAYLLPWFRPRRFPSTEARENPTRGRLELNDDIHYVSGAGQYRPGAALRLEESFDAANLALIQYHGYAPQPLIEPNFASPRARQLYYLIDMSAVTVQATYGKWLLKTESAYFNTHANPPGFAQIPGSYWATVSGIEYTFLRVLGDSDLGAIVEWMHDSRGDGPNGTPFHNDVFAGLRWVPNDQADSQFLGGVARDLNKRAAVFQLQYKRRIGKQLEAEAVGRAFRAVASSQLHALEDDSVLLLRLRYFF
jgi:hypothetical protein